MRGINKFCKIEEGPDHWQSTRLEKEMKRPQKIEIGHLLTEYT